MASDEMSIFKICPSCGNEAGIDCKECGRLVPCKQCERTHLSRSHASICKGGERCPVCFEAFIVPGLDPGCTQCANVICIECYERIENESCPICTRPYKENSIEESFVQRNGAVPGLHIGLGLILTEWYSTRCPKLASEVVSTNAWKAITYEETDLVECIVRLSKGSEFADPFPLGLAMLSEIVSCDALSKELRLAATKLDTIPPFPATEFIMKKASRKISLNLGTYLAEKTFWTSPDSASWLASRTFDAEHSAVRYASAGDCETALQLVAAATPSRLRQSVIDASDHYKSGYADFIRSDFEEDPFNKTVFLSRALDRGYIKAAYPLGCLYAKLGETEVAVSCLVAALTECYSPLDPKRPEPSSRAAEIHFMLGKLSPFNLGCAEVHFRAAASQGHRDAALLGARIVHRGSRNARETRRESKKLLSLVKKI